MAGLTSFRMALLLSLGGGLSAKSADLRLKQVHKGPYNPELMALHTNNLSERIRIRTNARRAEADENKTAYSENLHARVLLGMGLGSIGVIYGMNGLRMLFRLMSLEPEPNS